jgi:hypothetical protein
MQKGEGVISVAVGAAVLLVFLAVQYRWQLASLTEVASSAGEFILSTTGLRGQIPEISGYEKVQTYRLGNYRAGLYRVSPASLIFAPGRFVIYDADNKPVLKLDTLEGSKEPWTAVYDFAGRNGLPIPGSRVRPNYTRSLSGTGTPNVVIGQYSGGDHCCTTVTVAELGKDSMRVVGSVTGLRGLPFEGLEIRKADKNSTFELVAHRLYPTACGTHAEAADVVAVYEYANGQYTDQTGKYVEFLESVFRQNFQKWSREKERSLQLLQTIAAGYAVLGKREEGKRFFAMNLAAALPALRRRGVDPNTCLEDAEALITRLPSVVPESPGF